MNRYVIGFETVFLSEEPPEDSRIDRLIDWCQRYHKLGLVPKGTGNLSFRAEKGFVITGSGVNLGGIKREDLVKVSRVEIAGEQVLVYVEGRVAPSKESLLHAEIYNLRAEINAVFHTHSRMRLSWADEMGISLTEKGQLPGSHELVGEVRKLLSLNREVKYFGLRGHGIVSIGETLEEAGRLAEAMREIARSKREKVIDK